MARYLALLMLGVCCGCGSDTPTSSPITVPKTTVTAPTQDPTPAPPVELQIASYDEFLQWLTTQQGKVVVVDCWATYCAPCKQEFPHLVELAAEFPAERVLAVSLSFDGDADSDDTRKAVREFLTAQQAGRVRNYLLTEDTDDLYSRLNLIAIPAVYVYDTQGREHKRFENSDPKIPKFTYADVRATVRQLLGE